MGKLFRFVGGNKIKEMFLLDDMYKKFVLWALTGIKMSRLSKIYLEKERDLRLETWDLRFERERCCITEEVWKENLVKFRVKCKMTL